MSVCLYVILKQYDSNMNVCVLILVPAEVISSRGPVVSAGHLWSKLVYIRFTLCHVRKLLNECFLFKKVLFIFVAKTIL